MKKLMIKISTREATKSETYPSRMYYHNWKALIPVVIMTR